MMVLNSSLFCPNGQFLNKVTNYLCSNSLGLFTPCSVALLKDIYGQMRNNINTPFIGSNFGKRIKVQIYPLGQACLNGSIDQTIIIANGKLSCGHDLPVWLNNPETAKHRIMVLSQDPRRNKYEMGNMEIGVSSPFGLHSIIWRSSKLTGLIHHVSKRLIDDYGDSVSVYYTDILKLRICSWRKNVLFIYPRMNLIFSLSGLIRNLSCLIIPLVCIYRVREYLNMRSIALQTICLELLSTLQE